MTDGNKAVKRATRLLMEVTEWRYTFAKQIVELIGPKQVLQMIIDSYSQRSLIDSLYQMRDEITSADEKVLWDAVCRCPAVAPSIQPPSTQEHHDEEENGHNYQHRRLVPDDSN
jgi:hypothetical protein